MAVDRVDAPDDGDRDAAAALVDRRRVKIVRGLQPVGGRREVVAVRPAVAADEDRAEMIAAHVGRSEEHTSELQSLMRISYAVFCLKKKHRKPHNKQHTNTPTTSVT